MATLFDSFKTGYDGDTSFGSSAWRAQTFTPVVDFTITSVKFKGHKVDTPGTITISIRATSAGLPTGPDLVSGTFDGNTMTDNHSSPQWYEVIFSSGLALTNGVQYAIVCRSSEIGNFTHWNADNSSPTYSGGTVCFSNDSGSNWATDTRDAFFECWGNPVGTAVMFVVGNRDAVRVGSEASIWAYNENSELQWSYDTGGNTEAVVLDSSGNVYIVGTAADNGDGNGTRNLWKLSSSGEYLNGRHVQGSGFAWDLALDSAGRIIVGTGAGVARVAVDFASEELVISGGTVQAIAVDLNDDSFYVGSGAIPVNIRKYDSNLSLLWSRDPSTTVSVVSLDILSNRNIVAGFQWTSGLKIVYCYDKDGDFQWDYDGVSAHAEEVRVDSSDNVYVVTGHATKGLVCLNSSGVEQWYVTSDSFLQSVFINNSDVVYIVGTRYGSVAGWKEDSQSLIDVLQSPSTILRGIYGTSVVDLVPTRIKVDHYVTGDNTSAAIYGSNRLEAQTFTPDQNYLATSVKIKLYRLGSPGILTVSIRNTDPITGEPIGSDLTSGTVNANNFTSSSIGQWYEILLTEYNLVLGTKYAVVLYAPDGDSGNAVFIRHDSIGNYAGEKIYYSGDGGASWTPWSTMDFMFETLKNAIIPPRTYNPFDLQLDIR